MKPEWEKYLQKIGITELYFARVKKVIDEFQKICSVTFEDIFITEHVDKEGNRQYENLWLFSPNAIFESKLFLTQDNFDYTWLSVNYWCVKKNDYDFEKATAKSRMTIEIGLDSNVHGQFKSSGENCDYLKNLFRKYIVPNTKTAMIKI